MSQREIRINKIVEILENYPKGIRHSELYRQIAEIFPNLKRGTIIGTINNLDRKENSQIIRPERGLFILKKYVEGIVERRINVENNIHLPTEESFYKTFANYLEQDLGECTVAISLGGNRFGDRWGTPDVIGVYKFYDTDPVRPPVEIISAEIKIDINQLITAFGQACAYKIFSHKVYLAVPKESTDTDIKRIESLCARFGIGLILFNRNDSYDPKWEIRTRAIKSEPDYFYLNVYLQKLGKEERELLF